MAVEDEMAVREELRHARKLDRKEQKERLEEIIPRAEAGTHERRMEKKREVNDKMRSFRDQSPGAVEEIGENDLMGGGEEDGIGAYKAKKKEMERKKNERELRREEVLRVSWHLWLWWRQQFRGVLLTLFGRLERLRGRKDYGYIVPRKKRLLPC